MRMSGRGSGSQRGVGATHAAAMGTMSARVVVGALECLWCFIRALARRKCRLKCLGSRARAVSISDKSGRNRSFPAVTLWMHELLLATLEPQLRNHIVARPHECRVPLSMRRPQCSSWPGRVHASVRRHRRSPTTVHHHIDTTRPAPWTCSEWSVRTVAYLIR